MRATAKFLNVMVTLIEDLKKVKDFRSPQGQRHPLWRVLLIVIWGTMAGYIGYRALGDFAKFNQKIIRKTLQLHDFAVPSYSTIRRVMTGVKPEDLNQMFNQWASQLNPKTSELDWLAIDGKSLKSTVTNFHNSSPNFVSVVSAFNLENSCCVWGTFFENKLTSEIKQVRDIVKHSPGAGRVFTLDALHCQKPTVNQIVATQNHYLIALKKNQKTLYNSLVEVSQTQATQSFFSQKDSSHGRQLIRETSVFDLSYWSNLGWAKLQSLIKVERVGNRGLKPYKHTAYYISSLLASAQVFAAQIRGHWRIENQLHWVKDVIFQEDSWSIHQFQAATNFSILRTIAINLFRFLGFLSVTEAQRWLGNRVDRLMILLE